MFYIDKYVPNNVDDIFFHKDIYNMLEIMSKDSSIPHLLFHGSPGTGKTSTILALAKELFGHDFFRQRVTELNASDERGIAVVREKIKKFA